MVSGASALRVRIDGATAGKTRHLGSNVVSNGAASETMHAAINSKWDRVAEDLQYLSQERAKAIINEARGIDSQSN